MAASFIHFRTDTDMAAKLDEAAVRLGPLLEGAGISATRSTAARYLLSQALGEPLETAAVRETLKRVHAVVQRAANRAVRDLMEELPEYINEELDR